VKASSVKETDVSKSRNVQSEIGELEKKLMDLEKKMENIEIPSSNDEEDNGVI
jgi:protein subunit release factor A